jgi:hypothetical protein
MAVVQTHPQDPPGTQDEKAVREAILRALDAFTDLRNSWYWMEGLSPEMEHLRWMMFDTLNNVLRSLIKKLGELPRPKQDKQENRLPGTDWRMLDPKPPPAAGLPGSDWGVLGNPPGQKLEGSEWPPFRGPGRPLPGSDWRSLDPNLPPQQLPGSDWRLLNLQIGAAILRAVRHLAAVRRGIESTGLLELRWFTESLSGMIRQLGDKLRSRGWVVFPDRVIDPFGHWFEY